MITTIIFSFDRAMQLELLLNSIVNYDEKKILSLNILFNSSTPEFLLGYNKLIQKYPTLNWISETKTKNHFVPPCLPFYWHNYYWWLKYKHNRWTNSNFKAKVIEIISNSQSKFVMFLTDDSLFFKKIILDSEVIQKVKDNPLNTCFSFRHGGNIYGGNISKTDDFIKWRRNDHHSHPEWSYPFSVDGHIYDRGVLTKILKKVIFKNPNTLEANVACYVNENKLFNNHIANLQSCLLGFELNRVQSISANNNLNIINIDLNKLYLSDYQLQIKYRLNKPHLFRPEIQIVTATKNNESILLYEK